MSEQERMNTSLAELYARELMKRNPAHEKAVRTVNYFWGNLLPENGTDDGEDTENLPGTD
jgi:hypothetical protein